MSILCLVQEYKCYVEITSCLLIRCSFHGLLHHRNVGVPLRPRSQFGQGCPPQFFRSPIVPSKNANMNEGSTTVIFLQTGL